MWRMGFSDYPISLSFVRNDCGVRGRLGQEVISEVHERDFFGG